MKRRLNIAIALVARPQIVLLDEPTAGVDPQSRNHIFETVERLNREGMTVIYTTHYMEEADRLCQRILIMDLGKVVREGAPAELKAQIGDPAKVSLEDVFLSLTGKSLRG
jgi:ABC-2 type transport system ATP-binding protein